MSVGLADILRKVQAIAEKQEELQRRIEQLGEDLLEQYKHFGATHIEQRLARLEEQQIPQPD